MKKSVELNYDLLNELFSYDPITGEIRNKTNRSNNSKLGDLSTNLNKSTGYYTVYFEGHTVCAHRVAYCLYHKSIDKDLVVMHGPGGCLDNSIKNLKLGTHTENMRDRKKSKSNTTGYTGVYRVGDKYQAQIDLGKVEGKRKRKTKTFKKIEDAINWRLNEQNKISGYTFNHGK